MPTIHLTTFIAAPAERVFDLCRSIEMHRKSMAHTREEAIAGTTNGLIGLDETVTWKARHLLKTRMLKSKITAMNRPHSFTDEMVTGDFKSLKHEHHFKAIGNGTLLIDLFRFESPYGGIGRLVNKLFLARYLKKMLEQRNQAIKEYAESDKWKFVLDK
ncbi:MAG: SRPBCC family protein [Bacteroidota bacterium]|nr:SRPBCC family protein [Bacteroidota bacterium]MDP4216311.1 SRPBCC family protein [Bacteroidota bacterium]MDP4244947.1 SRPBCC family protein [Bacteroidota bacterium]MDP4255918.1 SRPBCC family protein [Bacteroidota bacterium]MDP4258465.1 SRPBCC family protein [Bacteroidota bacterium]